jgi:hypothetical protein
MKLQTPVKVYSGHGYNDIREDVIENVKAGELFELQEGDTRTHQAVADASVSSGEVFVPCELFADPWENLFGKKEYDKDGYLKLNTSIDIFSPWGRGFDIRYSAKGFGFGGLQVFVRDGKIQTDTECLNVENLTAIIRAVAPQLAELLYSLDPSVVKDIGEENLPLIVEHRAAKQAYKALDIEIERLKEAGWTYQQMEVAIDESIDLLDLRGGSANVWSAADKLSKLSGPPPAEQGTVDNQTLNDVADLNKMVAAGDVVLADKP